MRRELFDEQGLTDYGEDIFLNTVISLVLLVPFILLYAFFG